MPIRNPFAKRTDVYGSFAPGDENVRALDQNGTRPAFEKVDTMGSKSSVMSIRSGHSQEPPEYKMSGMPIQTRLGAKSRLINSPL
jgi:hypothetical protein